jgi:hypothetical protein
LGALGINVDRNQLADSRHKLEQMTGLSTGRRAGIEYTHAGLCPK